MSSPLCSIGPRQRRGHFRKKRGRHESLWRDCLPIFVNLQKSLAGCDADHNAGSPKPGDMIARNPKNHADKWLVAAEYFTDNFEAVQ